MYKLGLKLWSVNTDCYYQEAIKLYGQSLFDYIELYIVPNSLSALGKWKRIGIPFVIHCPHFMHGLNLAKAEMEKSNLSMYQQVKQFADELQAKYIIFHGGIDGDIQETARQLANFKEPRALIENKPYLALPNQMGGALCRGYNPEEIKFVMQASGCGFCLDFGHAICAANSQRLNVYAYCSTFLKLFPAMYHVTDLDSITSPYDSHLHLGMGQVDFNQIFGMIENNARVTFETEKNSKDNLDDFAEDMKWLSHIR